MADRKSNRLKRQYSLEKVENDEAKKLRQEKEITKETLEKLLNIKKTRLDALQNAHSAM